jgi:allophanate hydrolase subunit 2
VALRRVEVPQGRDVFRVTEGPQVDWFTAESVTAFYASAYMVTADVNRMGIRLAGAALGLAVSRELITEGVSLGCVQVPAGGQPVILFVEQQTTGGYPKIANVIAAEAGGYGPISESRFAGGAGAALYTGALDFSHEWTRMK